MLLATAAAAMPAYWTVHIDFPQDRAAFERVDAQFDATIRGFYATHNVAAPVVWRIVTAAGAYLGLRPRGTMADVAMPALPADLSKELHTKTAPISEATHKVLRAHHSELWHVETEMTTRAADAPPRKYTMMRVDVVSPPRDDDYVKAMRQFVSELSASGIETLAFFSSYGDGAYHYIFSSDKPIHVRALKGFGETRDVTITSLEIR